jgi:hypothetical protein
VPDSDGGAPILDYEVYMTNGQGGPFESTGMTGKPSVRYMTIGGLYPELDYAYKVRAINRVGPGPFSKYTVITTAVIADEPAPTVPQRPVTEMSFVVEKIKKPGLRTNNFIPRETILSVTDNPREMSKGNNFKMDHTTYDDANHFYATNAGYFNSRPYSRAKSQAKFRGSFAGTTYDNEEKSGDDFYRSYHSNKKGSPLKEKIAAKLLGNV